MGHGLLGGRDFITFPLAKNGRKKAAIRKHQLVRFLSFCTRYVGLECVCALPTHSFGRLNVPLAVTGTSSWFWAASCSCSCCTPVHSSWACFITTKTFRPPNAPTPPIMPARPCSCKFPRALLCTLQQASPSSARQPEFCQLQDEGLSRNGGCCPRVCNLFAAREFSHPALPFRQYLSGAAYLLCGDLIP